MIRTLAIALIAHGSCAEGVDLITQLARAEPQALHGGSAPGLQSSKATASAFHEAASHLMSHANREKSGKVYFAAAVFKRWQADYVVATRMLDRARAVGFEPSACDLLEESIVSAAGKRRLRSPETALAHKS